MDSEAIRPFSQGSEKDEPLKAMVPPLDGDRQIFTEIFMFCRGQREEPSGQIFFSVAFLLVVFLRDNRRGKIKRT